MSTKETQEKIEEELKNKDHETSEHIDVKDYNDIEEDELKEKLQERDLLIEELETRLDDTKDSLLRKAAELDNVRKRMQRQRTQLFESAKVNAVEQFLPINDDLQRTREAAEQEESEDDILDGVIMIAEKFEETLREMGVEKINETGVPFDVNLHDAMFRQKPEDNSIDSDIVLQIVENGYKLGDKTIRHAKVIVSE